MKKLLLALVLLCLPTLAFAQSQRNPCYKTDVNSSNCISVSSDTPLPTTVAGTGVGGAGVSTNTNDNLASNLTGLNTINFNYQYDGATWDREYACPFTVPVTVAAGATTELVSLVAAQQVRVCAFVISGDAVATVATFVQGTGANCGTGTGSLTGAMRIAVDNNIAIAAGSGSVLRTAAGNALCLTAATGNVTGFVTYARF